MHRRRSSVNFRGHDIFAWKMYEKLTKCPNFYDIVRKINKIPNFAWFLTEKCPNLYKNCPEKLFPDFFFGGGGCPRLSYAAIVMQGGSAPRRGRLFSTDFCPFVFLHVFLSSTLSGLLCRESILVFTSQSYVGLFVSILKSLWANRKF